MPPLILSPSFNSTGSISAPPNLTISGTMSAASGFVWGTQGAIIDEYAAGNQIRMYTNTAGKGGWFYFPAGLTVNNSLYITGNSVLSASATDVYTTLQNSSTGGRTWHINATSSASGEGGGKLLIKDGTASATRLAIDSSGNVGIGTSSPNLRSEVWQIANGGTNVATSALRTTPQLLLKGFGGSSTYHSGIAFSMNEHTSGYWGSGILSHDDTGSYGSALTFYTSTGLASASPTEKMRITSDGKVGIGTNNPTCSFDIQGSWSTGNGPFLQLKNTSGATPGSFGPGIILSNSVSGKSNFMIQQYQDAASAFSINKYDSPYTSYFAISQTGSVGIGTTSPSQALDVVGNIQLKATAGSTTYLVIDSPVVTGGGSMILFRTGGVDKWQVFSYQTNNRLYIQDADSNDGVYMAQNTTAWVSNSDLRLKNVQGTITNALDKVQQLTGVKFTWKRESDNPDVKVRVGLIAQDVQAVLPEAVDDDSPDIITDEDTGRVSGGLGVRYTEVVPLLVNAIKELTARVVALESQISSGAA